MLQIFYFAHLRDVLAVEREQLDWQADYRTVADIKQTLSQRGPGWQRALSDSSILVAVNQQMGAVDSPVSDGDEIAFFPPVTGG